MGWLSFQGGASGKKYTIREVSSGEVQIYNESDDVIILKGDPTSIKDASNVQLSAHGSRHRYGGEDAIPDDGLQYSQVKVAFGTEFTVSVDAGSTSTISEGVYYARCGANTSVEYSNDGGTTWHTLVAAGSVGLVFSDGSNVRFNNAGGSAEDSYLLPIE